MADSSQWSEGVASEQAKWLSICKSGHASYIWCYSCMQASDIHHRTLPLPSCVKRTFHLFGNRLSRGMVHAGFSRGCERCRDNHLGCDQTIPECTKCTARGLPCTGYRDEGGFLFKDESAKVIKNGKQRHARRVTAGAYTGSITGSIVEAGSRSASQSPNGSVAHLLSPDATNITQLSEYNYLYLFLETYFMFNRNTTTTRAHLDALVFFYQGADLSSPLLPVLSQVAGQLLSLHHGIRYNSPWHLRSRVEASKAMRTALCDPVQRRKNETLLALILLDLGERIDFARLLTLSPVEHHNAAMALVSERGPESFQDAVSQSLLDAARYSVIRNALWADEECLNLDVFARADNGRPTTRSMALDHVISRVLTLRRQVSSCLRGEHRDSQRVLAHLSSTRQDLETQLLEWVETIPANWHPSLQPNPGLETFSRHRNVVEIYSSYETAFIYNQWRCIQLLLLGILQSLPSPKPPANAGLENNETKTAIRERAQTLCEAILSAAPYMFGKPRRKNNMYAPDEIKLLGRPEDDLEKEKQVFMNYTKGARLGHWSLFELLQWMLRIVADAEHGIAVDPKTVVEAEEYLANLWL